MAENKTIPNDNSVEAFLDAVQDEQKRKDSYVLIDLMKQVTGEEPKMWGTSIVGFGTYHYKYESGREGDMIVTGFSPRSQNLALYGLGGFEGADELLQKLGKYSTGKSCLYIKRMSEVDVPTLKTLIDESVKHSKAKH